MHSRHKLYDEAEITLLKDIYKRPDGVCFSEEIIFNYQTAKLDASIILPCYNVEKYLRDCLNSIAAQKTVYSYEVIAINDGSRDQTLQILEEYKGMLPNLIILSQENAGASQARNAGLKIAQGKYLMFIDSDDRISENYVQTLLEKGFTENADIVSCGYSFLEKNTVIAVKGAGNPESIHALSGFPWGKAIRREFFNHLLFPAGYWFEDTILSHLVYPRARNVKLIQECQYFYRKNNAGITKTSKAKIKSLDSFYITALMFESYPFFLKEGEYDLQYISNLITSQFYINETRILGINRQYRKEVFRLQSKCFRKLLKKEDFCPQCKATYVYALRSGKFWLCRLSIALDIICKLAKKLAFYFKTV